MHTLKKILQSITLILLICCAMQLGCKKDVSLDLSGTYSIKLNHTKNIPYKGKAATITVNTISDSRCPSNAVCVRAGDASVKLTIEDAKQKQVVELCKGDCGYTSKPGVKELVLNDVLYTVTLDDVTPYPGEKNATQTAVISIKKGR